MVAWVNRSVVQGPRNGTTTHTVSFAPATAGALLVAVVSGSVTSTTPSGWSLPAGGSAINQTGLYVWWKIATSGEASFTSTHNASNYPVLFAVYEFPPGSSFVKSVSAPSVAMSAANPAVTALTGTNLIGAVKAAPRLSGDAYTETVWSGTPTPVRDVDTSEPGGATDGYRASIAFIEAFTGASAQPTGAVTGRSDTSEALTFAIKVAAGGGGSFPVVGVVRTTSTITGVVTARRVTVGVVKMASTVSGVVTVRRAASGVVTAVTAVTGVMSGRHTADGVAQAVSAVTGAVTARRPTTGTVQGVTVVAGAVTARRPIAGTVQGLIAVTGTVTARLTTTGTTGSVSNVTGQMEPVGGLTGTITSTGTITGQVTARRPVTGSTGSTSTVRGQLDTPGALAGTVTASSSTTGTITARLTATGATHTASTATGAVTARFTTRGTVQAVTTVTGHTGRSHVATGRITTTSTVLGDLIHGGMAPIPDRRTLTPTTRPRALTGHATARTLTATTPARHLKGPA